METREKQAYLIEAHKCDEMLLTLLRMLDVPWNDILDNKAGEISFQDPIYAYWLKTEFFAK